MRIQQLGAWVTLGVAVTANLNYLSPSRNHPQYARNIQRSELEKREEAKSSDLSFTHGIASGDPYADSVILWTRAVPPGVKEDQHDYGGGSEAVCVGWEVATSLDFSDILQSGQTETSGDVDYTVKVEATGLKPKTHYWYRFKACDGEKTSPIGRTKTLPAEDDEVKEGVKIAIYSCANYVEGFFNVYGMSARKESVDYVLHLGDYIYETPFPPANPLRIVKPYKELVTLRDYRMRHAHYKTDLDLLHSHRLFPWLTTWDDHEIANNGWRSSSASNFWRLLEAKSWDSRMHAGVRSYFEYMPVRQVDAANSLRIWRSFKIGRLADLIMLDTRYYDRDIGEKVALRNNEHRSMMGQEQEDWLDAELAESSRRNATWALLGQQIQFSNINETAIGRASKDAPFYLDGWSGYTANRRRVLESITKHNVSNPVVLTGDYHTLWAADLIWDNQKSYEPVTGNGSLGIELAVTSVTSSSGYGRLSYDDATAVSKQLVEDNNFLKWAEGNYRGYFELELTPQRLEAVYFAVPQMKQRSFVEREISRWGSVAGEKKLRRPFGGVEEGWMEGM